MFLVVLLDVVQELLALEDLDVGGKADFFESLTQNQLLGCLILGGYAPEYV